VATKEAEPEARQQLPSGCLLGQDCGWEKP